MTEDGTFVPVEDLLDTGEWQPVYNLRIADFHTYFVGCDEWGFSVWAHNACTVNDVQNAVGSGALRPGEARYVAGLINKGDFATARSYLARKGVDPSSPNVVALRLANGDATAPVVTPAMQQKILMGEQIPNPASPGGMSSQVRGGHSPAIKSDPRYVFEAGPTQRGDGTTTGKFIMELPSAPGMPNRTSSPKPTTMAPDSWTSADIHAATLRVADTAPFHTNGLGKNLHQGVVNGVEWQVITSPGGRVVESSFPVGISPLIPGVSF